MRLVGASNWFIRTPFLLEGVLQALIGASLAILSVVGLQAAILPRLPRRAAVPGRHARPAASMTQISLVARSSRASSSAWLARRSRCAATSRSSTLTPHSRNSVRSHEHKRSRSSSCSSLAVIIGCPAVSSAAIARGRVRRRRADVVRRPSADASERRRAGRRGERSCSRSEALEPPSETSATAGAIQGLLDSSGDKYALYFDPSATSSSSTRSMAGEFGGIGVVLGEKDGTAYVVEVYKDTPADKAGIKSGDIFVGDRRRTPREVDERRGREARARRRGHRGQAHDGSARARRASPARGRTRSTLKRAMIELPNLESELKGDGRLHPAGPVQRRTPPRRSPTRVESLEKKGAKSFVLDLRDNPGGLLDQAVERHLAVHRDGVVVQVEERDREPRQSLAPRATR